MTADGYARAHDSGRWAVLITTDISTPWRPGAVADDWITAARDVLTRDLVLRASRVTPVEGRALLFRALHLNVPLAREVAERLARPGGSADDEGGALEGLHRAVSSFDPTGVQPFRGFAVPLIEDGILSRRTAPASPR